MSQISVDMLAMNMFNGQVCPEVNGSPGHHGQKLGLVLKTGAAKFVCG